MTKHDDGGPAYPVVVGGNRVEGMSLLDYFAGQVIAGESIDQWEQPLGLCSNAYEIAQAMVAEKRRREGGDE